MNWIKNVVRPGFRMFSGKKEGEGGVVEKKGADGLWSKCEGCGEMLYCRDVEASWGVCGKCGVHAALGWRDRLRLFFGEKYEMLAPPPSPEDPLSFRDRMKYEDRLKKAREAGGGASDSVVAAVGKICGRRAVLGVQDFAFLGGSLGVAAGGALVDATKRAQSLEAPLVLCVASGGARMQEGIWSLMQMPRVTSAVMELKEAGLPYVVVLTNPTTGGVTASYAMLGDVHIAEPGARVGFAGPRVIEQTVKEMLPESFQRAESLLEHGMVDMVSPRGELKEKVGAVLGLLGKRRRG